MAIPLRIREAPRPQVQSQQALGSNMMSHLGPSRHGNASAGMPPPQAIDRRLNPWGQMTPDRSPQGHLGVHYGPIPVQGTPQDRFRREVLGHGRGEVMGWGPRSTTPAPTPTLLSLKSSGPPLSNHPQMPSGPRQPVESPTTAAQRLSHACQKRGFNPMFEVFTTPGGRHGCNVNIGGALLRNESLFDSTKQAKEDTAMKGLDYLRQRGWAIGSQSPPTSSRGRARSQVHPAPSQAPSTHSQGPVTRSQASIAHLEASVARLEATVAGLQTPTTSSRERSAHPRLSDFHGQEQDVEMTDVPASNSSRVSGIGAAQQAELLEQIQRITGMDVIDPSRESAEVTRAYLEGLTVGSRLAVTARRRSRSPTRSPQTSRVNRHRERSPVEARVRLTPPPVYERWSGRPATDRYRPDDHYRPGEDGRLRENTRARILDRESGEPVESGEASDQSSGKDSDHESGNNGQKRSSSQP
ncbi:hypothetical protein QBC36DRAFT_369489 [Triangularia setosa]|uniref:Uncharacterized protein n=1 Tax=Triangularia setosa TaxID=2587417 RepID=A0AAN6WAP6_9PEZI|nr:hypothetical protein QBC36DRAFT_369489 [Podospora setosa]